MRAAVLAALAFLAAAPALGGDVSVTVEGLRNARGDVRIGLFVAEGWLDDRRTVGYAVGKAAPPSVRLVIPNVPPGTYGIAGYHDENGNGKHDTNFLGLPLEGYGFSRDAPVRLAPPAFDDARFEVPPEGAAVTLRMRY